MKKCPKCKLIKGDMEFYRRSARPDLLNSWCKRCENSRMAELKRTDPEKYREIDKKSRAKNPARVKRNLAAFHERNPGYTRDNSLRRNYGITSAQFAELLAVQGGKRAICGTDKPTGKGNSFHVDHCHEGGFIRGILCHKCNAGIGMLQDDPVILGKAIQYLIAANNIPKGALS